MNNDFINGIQFKENVKLKRPKKRKKGPRRFKSLFPKLLRLAFFCLMLYFLFVGGNYAIRGTVSFTQGTELKSWDQIAKEWKEIREE